MDLFCLTLHTAKLNGETNINFEWNIPNNVVSLAQRQLTTDKKKKQNTNTQRFFILFRTRIWNECSNTYKSLEKNKKRIK